MIVTTLPLAKTLVKRFLQRFFSTSDGLNFRKENNCCPEWTEEFFSNFVQDGIKITKNKKIYNRKVTLLAPLIFSKFDAGCGSDWYEVRNKIYSYFELSSSQTMS